VIQKNVVLIQDTLNPGMAAVKHANGRDWWISIFRENTSDVYKILLSPSGLTNFGTQTLNYSLHTLYNGSPVFSGSGNKFAYYYFTGTFGNVANQIRVMDFDRCNGMFSNFDSIIQVDSLAGFGLAFSSSSNYLYWCTWNKVFQIRMDTTNISASQQLIAINDGYYSPYPPFQTDFWLMYLAANGKIYISSGNGVLDLHYINYPDSSGFASNLQQHALHLPCYSARGHVNHPNYYLGPVAGSICDSLGVGVTELEQVRNFTLYPNPVKSGGSVEISYLLPQDQSGVFEINDDLGRTVLSHPLPNWSTFQQIQLPLLAPGLYVGSISSLKSRNNLKMVVY
jgi:hypothetical protein